MLEPTWLPPKSLRFFIVILLILGIFFRFANLDQKLFWGDECITTVRVAGYTGELVNKSIKRGEIISPEEMKKFQRVNQDTSLLDTIRVTALEAPQHTPLYFVLTRVWVQFFGNSVSAMRSFTALTSLLVLPAIYWLCIELFDSYLFLMGHQEIFGGKQTFLPNLMQEVPENNQQVGKNKHNMGRAGFEQKILISVRLYP